jgi:glutamine---fructose-6-phosphate transaminase (isomerizing)
MKSLGNFPDPFIAEISGQPDAMRRAAAGMADQLPALETLAAGGADPAAPRALVFTGMGSSYDACYPAVTELAAAGVTALQLDAAELLHFRRPMLGSGVVLVAVSQSGRSAELVRLVGSLRTAASRPLIAAVTNGADNPLADAADVVIDTRAGGELGPSTMTFAASLVAVAAAGAILAGEPVAAVVARLLAESEVAARAVEVILSDVELPHRLAEWLGDRDALVLLARGPARAAAEMGALTLKEAVGIPAESLETGQFRHGPLELAGPALAAVIVATEPETLDLDLGLAAELGAAGAAVLVVTTAPAEVPGALVTMIDPVPRGLAPAVSIVPTQLLAWRLAVLRGRDPGSYVKASKVTTRE